MRLLEQEIQAWVAREHPDMVEVEMDTWFHTIRMLNVDWNTMDSRRVDGHILPEPPRVSWSDIRPASIASEIVREEPRSEEEQIDFNELLRQSMDICYPPAQATQAPPENATVIESKECPICMEEFTGTNHIVGKCGHQFHASCLMQSLRSTDACPCCRQQVV